LFLAAAFLSFLATAQLANVAHFSQKRVLSTGGHVWLWGISLAAIGGVAAIFRYSWKFGTVFNLVLLAGCVLGAGQAINHYFWMLKHNER
jgi:hypothetical protein